MGILKTNPQNELGDIISEPCVKLNRFQVINQIVFFHFCSEGCKGMVGLTMALGKINPQNELGDIISEPCVSVNLNLPE